jgi:hypothetical protein
MAQPMPQGTFPGIEDTAYALHRQVGGQLFPQRVAIGDYFLVVTEGEVEQAGQGGAAA